MSTANPLNRYTCEKCGFAIITVDREDGVTPAFLRCRSMSGCSAMMVSAWYMNVKGNPTYEWRKPTKKEYRKMDAAMRQHIDRGGLNIYPIARTQ